MNHPIPSLRVLRYLRSSLSQNPLAKPSPLILSRCSVRNLTVKSCPSPTCACAPMPEGLDINRELPLEGNMATYDQQIVVATGRDASAWPSRVEEDESMQIFKQLRDAVGPLGKHKDKSKTYLITASDLQFEDDTRTPLNELTSFDALLLPSFRRLSTRSEPSSNETSNSCSSAALASPQQHFADLLNVPDVGSVRSVISTSEKTSPTSAGNPPSDLNLLTETTRITAPVILVCGHTARDSRCGILGPLLAAEFRAKLPDAHVALISHIGGHKFAGNVILYVPPGAKGNPLAGKGVWYGRVEPGHVEGIVETTVRQGVVVEDLFRGAIAPGGRALWLKDLR